MHYYIYLHNLLLTLLTLLTNYINYKNIRIKSFSFFKQFILEIFFLLILPNLFNTKL